MATLMVEGAPLGIFSHTKDPSPAHPSLDTVVQQRASWAGIFQTTKGTTAGCWQPSHETPSQDSVYIYSDIQTGDEHCSSLLPNAGVLRLRVVSLKLTRDSLTVNNN